MPAALLAQALALASAAGVSTYGTVALLGVATRQGWIGPLPPALSPVAEWWMIALAGTLYAVEFLATLIPGIASAWEALHTAIRPIAGAGLAAATVYHGDPRFTLAAALLGGTLALGTGATKLGARVAVDASPEPVTNAVANVAELGLFGSWCCSRGTTRGPRSAWCWSRSCWPCCSSARSGARSAPWAPHVRAAGQAASH
jgi:hypothetical protein